MIVHEMFPYLCVRGAAEAIEFYARAFGAVEKLRLTEPSGRIRDPFGHESLIGHHIEDVSPAEMQRRYTALFA